MFFSRPRGSKIVGRGNLSSVDFTATNFTIDGAWHTFDLSTILPLNTSSVRLSGSIVGANVNDYVSFKNDDDANDSNTITFSTPVVGVGGYGNGIIDCSSERKIKYKARNTVTTLNLSVIGWIIK